MVTCWDLNDIIEKQDTKALDEYVNAGYFTEDNLFQTDCFKTPAILNMFYYNFVPMLNVFIERGFLNESVVFRFDDQRNSNSVIRMIINKLNPDQNTHWYNKDVQSILYEYFETADFFTPENLRTNMHYCWCNGEKIILEDEQTVYQFIENSKYMFPFICHIVSKNSL